MVVWIRRGVGEMPDLAVTPTREEFIAAGRMLAWADDSTGNTGLVYGFCKEHDWRGRKRDVNNRYSDAHTVKWNATEDAAYHLMKKHRDA